MIAKSSGGPSTGNGKAPLQTLQAVVSSNPIMNEKGERDKVISVIVDAITGKTGYPNLKHADYRKGGKYEHFGYALKQCKGLWAVRESDAIETVERLRDGYEKTDQAKRDDLALLCENLLYVFSDIVQAGEKQREENNAGTLKVHETDSTVSDPLPEEFGGPEAPLDLLTLHDARKVLGETVYSWRPYLMAGGLTAIAGDVGAGKTAFAMDLHRRQWKHLVWPDGQDIEGGGKPIVYCMADQRLSQIADLASDYGVPDESIILATEAGGVTKPLLLDDPASLDRLAAIVRQAEPWAVAIDTFTSAMGCLEHSRPEVINGITDRLLGIAIENRLPVILLCHTNNSGGIYGKALGRKAEHQISLVLSDKSDVKSGRNLHPRRSRYLGECSSLGVVYGPGGFEYTEPYLELEVKEGAANRTLKDGVSEEALKMAGMSEGKGFTQIELVMNLLGDDRDEKRKGTIRTRVCRAISALVKNDDLVERAGRYYLPGM